MTVMQPDAVGKKVSKEPCPMREDTGCPGMLTKPFVINDEPQLAVICTHCLWLALA